MANNIPTQDDIDTDELKKQSLRDVVGEGSKILLTKAAARNDGGFIAPYQVTNSIAEVANQHYSETTGNASKWYFYGIGALLIGGVFGAIGITIIGGIVGLALGGVAILGGILGCVVSVITGNKMKHLGQENDEKALNNSRKYLTKEQHNVGLVKSQKTALELAKIEAQIKDTLPDDKESIQNIKGAINPDPYQGYKLRIARDSMPEQGIYAFDENTKIPSRLYYQITPAPYVDDSDKKFKKTVQTVTLDTNILKKKYGISLDTQGDVVGPDNDLMTQLEELTPDMKKKVLHASGIVAEDNRAIVAAMTAYNNAETNLKTSLVHYNTVKSNGSLGNIEQAEQSIEDFFNANTDCLDRVANVQSANIRATLDAIVGTIVFKTGEAGDAADIPNVGQEVKNSIVAHVNNAQNLCELPAATTTAQQLTNVKGRLRAHLEHIIAKHRLAKEKDNLTKHQDAAEQLFTDNFDKLKKKFHDTVHNPDGIKKVAIKKIVNSFSDSKEKDVKALFEDFEKKVEGISKDMPIYSIGYLKTANKQFLSKPLQNPQNNLNGLNATHIINP